VRYSEVNVSKYSWNLMLCVLLRKCNLELSRFLLFETCRKFEEFTNYLT
jgi:hypothetical protein